MEQSMEFRVVVNAEEQYSIWPNRKPLPLGWTGLPTTGTKEECLEYISSVWLDMRPRSIREVDQVKS